MKSWKWLFLFAAAISMAHPAHARDYKLETGTIRFAASDGVEITGDLYTQGDGSAPFVLLFHMASSSRGEYLSIAPKLVKLGFNCRAIDQRSGYAWRDTPNLTSQKARAAGKSTSYAAAYVDAESALLFVRDTFKPRKIILWGSSYSADLALILAAKHQQLVSRLLAFSPGSYFVFSGSPLVEYAKQVTCPAFLTTSTREASQSKPIFEAIPAKEKVFFLPKSGRGEHGSPALYETTIGQEEYWAAVKEFLKQP